jgi:Leucine-rich repeat (LRR) protein
MRRKTLIAFLFSIAVFSVHAQSAISPWETVAPAGSYVYTDLKTAVKDASFCYRLDLSGADFIQEKKILPKAAVLTNVMAFRLGNNNLTSIPTVFLQMHSLLYFNSTGNPLRELSDSLGMWSELHYIEFSGTDFDTLPKGLYGCSRLLSISITENKDTLHISKDISSLGKTVNELKIYSTFLDTLPDNLTSLSKLHKLVLYKCGIKEIPKPVLQMNQLQEIWLDSNSISVLPREIINMSGLTYLSLRGNKISHIPSTICFMKNLSVLDLRGNPLDPYEIHVAQALLPSCRIIF